MPIETIAGAGCGTTGRGSSSSPRERYVRLARLGRTTGPGSYRYDD
jgi:hypothetical protein